MIGSGLIGGKARGILLAQKILKTADPKWNEFLEVHDSFFIGSDVFYTYIIQNDCWWLRRKNGTIEDILSRAKIARERILQGKFLDYIIAQFQEMLDYFGQSPIVVRSSSLQEDSYGNAFSGKYESIFVQIRELHNNDWKNFYQQFAEFTLALWILKHLCIGNITDFFLKMSKWLFLFSVFLVMSMATNFSHW